jgi:hypothetical protein
MDSADVSGIPHIEGCLDEMFLQGSSGMPGIDMKLKECLGKPGIVKTSRSKDELKDVNVPSLMDAIFSVFSF